MKKKDVRNLVEEVGEMIQSVENHKGGLSGELSSQSLEALEKIEKSLEVIQSFQNQILSAVIGDWKEGIDSETQELINQAEGLKGRADAIYSNLSRATGRGRRERRRKSRRGPGREGAGRKNMFKSLGGDPNWKPL